MNPTPGDMPARKPQRVAVYFDYENMHHHGHEQFGNYATPRWATAPHPRKIAEQIVAKRSTEHRPSTLAAVKVYRGRPNPEREPKPASAFDVLASEWRRAGCILTARNLDYRNLPDGTFHVTEKGIDVALAVDLIKDIADPTIDVQILFSSDKDLLPAVEAVYDAEGAHVEAACWEGLAGLRLPGKKFFCHYMPGDVFAGSRSVNATEG